MEVENLHKTPQHPGTDCWSQAIFDYGKAKAVMKKAENIQQSDSKATPVCEQIENINVRPR